MRSAEGCSAVRLLAALPLQSRPGEAGQESLPIGFASARASAGKIYLQRNSLHHVDPQRSGSRQALAEAGGGRRQQSLEGIPKPGRDADEWRCKGDQVNDRFDYEIPGLNPEKSARRFRFTAIGRRWQYPAYGGFWSLRRCA